jgi:surface antigen
MFTLLIKLILALFKKKVIVPPIDLIAPKADPNDVLVHEAQDWVGTIDDMEHTVEAVNKFRLAVNAHPTGENWCADFVIFCIKQVETKLNIKSPIEHNSELAQDLWFKSPSFCQSTTPFPGAIIVWRHGDTNLGHCGIVEAVAKDGTLTTIEGNTGQAPGIVRDGGGVYRRFRTPTGTAAMSVIGFLRAFS